MSSLILNPSNSGSGSVTLNIFGDDTEYNINLPKTNGTLVSSVNGKGADSNGNVAVTIPSIASNADAINGTNNTKIMTPLQTKEAINKYGFAYKKLSSINSVAGSFWFDYNSGINDSEIPHNVINADWVGIQFGTDIGNEKQQIIFNGPQRWYRYSDDNLGSENWSDWTSSIHLTATSAEAQAGTVTNKLMTPALVKSAVAKFNSASATKLQTKQNIDGVQFDGTANIHHFATCSTAAGTTEKVVPMSGFVLATGARIVVKFTVTNTVSAPTMNVNGTGAKPIKYHGGSFTASYLGANKVHEFVYDGANWCFVGDLDTRYTHPNSGVTAGTYNTVTVNAQGHVTGGNNAKYVKSVDNISADVNGNVALGLHAVATSGNYNDLTNKPSIPPATRMMPDYSSSVQIAKGDYTPTENGWLRLADMNNGDYTGAKVIHKASGAKIFEFYQNRYPGTAIGILPVRAGETYTVSNVGSVFFHRMR